MVLEYVPTFTPKIAQLCRKIFQHHGACGYVYPIGSMYGIYANIYHQYIPVMLAYIPAP